MRRLQFDEYEFDSPSTEEKLILVIGTKAQFPDLAAFALHAGIASFNGTSVFEQLQQRVSELKRGNWTLDYTKRFAGVELSSGESRMVLLNDEWNDFECVIDSVSHFVWYHWSTTA